MQVDRSSGHVAASPNCACGLPSKEEF
jgi:hypothetical protein